MIKNIEWIKITNIRRIIDYAIQKDVFSKRDVSDALGMCFTTASNLINQMEEKGVLEGITLSRGGTAGRTPKNYRLESKKYYFLSIVFSNRSLVTMALINLKHEIVVQLKFSVDKNDDWDGLSRELCESYQTLLIQAAAEDEQIVALGISVQGSYSVGRDIVTANEWHALDQRHLCKDLTGLFGKPVVIQNDIDAAAMYRSICTSDNYLVYIYIGYQVGSSVVLQGNLLNGYDGLTTEVAHIPMGKNKNVCDGCGAHGCLETNLSKGAMLRDFFQKEYPISARGYSEDWEKFVEAAVNHDPRAEEVLIEKAELLSRLIITLVAVTRVNSVVISGIPGELYALMYPHIIEMLKEWGRRYTVQKISFDRDAERTILVGTMDAAYQNWYPDFDTGDLWSKNAGGQHFDTIQTLW